MEQPDHPEEVVGRPVPDIALSGPDGQPFSLKSRIGSGPLVLFFYIRNSTPG